MLRILREGFWILVTLKPLLFPSGMSARRGVKLAGNFGNVMVWWMLSFSLFRLRLDRKIQTAR